MELPECDIFKDELVLNYRENLELITKLVEEGPQYLDKFLKEQEKKDSAIAKYIKSFRQRLEKQAASIRGKREKKYIQKMNELAKTKDAQAKAMQKETLKLTEEQRALQERLNDILASEMLSDEFIQLVMDTPLDLTEEKKSLGRRLLEGIIIFFIFIGSKIKKFLLWLGRKLKLIKKAPEVHVKPSKPKLLLQFSSITGDFGDFDMRFANALLTSQNLRQEVESDMLKSKRLRRQRLSWRRRFKKQKYIEDARRSFYSKMEERVKKKTAKVKVKQEALSKKAKDLKLRERKTEKKAKEEEERLKAQKKREEEQIKEQLDKKPKEKAKSKVVERLENAGFITQKGDELHITSQLVDRFADIVFTAEIENLPLAYHAIYGASEVEGVYERGRLRSVDEISRMDIVESMINARIRHPYNKHLYEEDVITHRDLKGANNHVVLMFDKSGSMDENRRIYAAKKSVLALYKAVKEKNPRNVIDLVAFDTEVRVMDLLDVWESEANGFTNTGEAVKTARALLQDSSADRKLVYLITDGLPEAYTEDDNVYAGDTNRSLTYAVDQARELSFLPGIHFTMILLEPKERIYIDAARKIVDAAGGKALVVEPQELAAEMLMDYVTL